MVNYETGFTIRAYAGAFERALEGINHLCERNIVFQINVTLTEHNAEQLEDIYMLVKLLGAVAVHIFMLVPVGCRQIFAETDMFPAEQVERRMLEICQLDSCDRLQVKITCVPHYERVIRQQGLHQVTSRTKQAAGAVPGRHEDRNVLRRMSRQSICRDG